MVLVLVGNLQESGKYDFCRSASQPAEYFPDVFGPFSTATVLKKCCINKQKLNKMKFALIG